MVGYGVSTFRGYLMFYFKQFSLAWEHSLSVKNISISRYSLYSDSSNLTNSV